VSYRAEALDQACLACIAAFNEIEGRSPSLHEIQIALNLTDQRSAGRRMKRLYSQRRIRRTYSARGQTGPGIEVLTHQKASS
jgi:SOS-response transcriptional repressor LexA